MIWKKFIESAGLWARRIKRDLMALWIAASDQRTPTIAKLVAGLVAAYAFSPIDLIPDFIPVIGYLDDLLIVPLGIMLAVKLIPTELMADYRAAAAARLGRPKSRLGLLAVVLTWILMAVLAFWWASRLYP